MKTLRKTALAMAALALAACQPVANSTRLEGERINLGAVSQLPKVELVLLGTYREVADLCEPAVGAVGAGLRYRGCAVLSDSQCTIVALAPSSWGDRHRLATIGHEALHCAGATHSR